MIGLVYESLGILGFRYFDRTHRPVTESGYAGPTSNGVQIIASWEQLTTLAGEDLLELS